MRTDYRYTVILRPPARGPHASIETPIRAAGAEQANGIALELAALATKRHGVEYRVARVDRG